MTSRTAEAKRPYTAGLTPLKRDHGVGTYGGLIGQMIGEINTRMIAGAAGHAENPEDFLHRISVASGYVGPVAAF
jgi:hypothetical protein